MKKLLNIYKNGTLALGNATILMAKNYLEVDAQNIYRALTTGYKVKGYNVIDANKNVNDAIKIILQKLETSERNAVESALIELAGTTQAQQQPVTQPQPTPPKTIEPNDGLTQAQRDMKAQNKADMKRMAEPTPFVPTIKKVPDDIPELEHKPLTQNEQDLIDEWGQVDEDGNPISE